MCVCKNSDCFRDCIRFKNCFLSCRKVQRAKRTQPNYTVQIAAHVGLQRITTSFSDLIICGTYNKLTPTSWPTLYVWAPAHFKLHAVKFLSSLKCATDATQGREKVFDGPSFIMRTKNHRPLSFVWRTDCRFVCFGD